DAREPNGSVFHRVNVERRTIVKGAAWSIPVIAAGVAVPGATASGQAPWNVSIDGQCVANVGGTGQLAPGFRVVADPGTEPIPATLNVTETAAGTWSMTLPAPNVLGGTTDPTQLPAADLALGTSAPAYASATVAAVSAHAAL